MAVDSKRYKLDLDATGGLNKDQTQWKGTVDTLDINGAFNLKLQNRLNLEPAANAFPQQRTLGGHGWQPQPAKFRLGQESRHYQ